MEVPGRSTFRETERETDYFRGFDLWKRSVGRGNRRRFTEKKPSCLGEGAGVCSRGPNTSPVD